jgi:ubiquitin-protein ligase E3 A
LPADYFSRILQVLQGQLTYLSKNAIDRPITQAVMVLEKLHQVNEQHKSVPYTSFYNEAISRRSDLEEDYKRYRGGAHIFSFCRYAFLLDPDAKSRILHIDAAYQQRAHFEQAVLQNIFAQPSLPYLVLTLERSNVIGHTLSQLAQKTQDLKKPLKVVFANEPAADEGGVTKEFFQIVVREIFDPNYGMRFFFLPASQYTLTAWRQLCFRSSQRRVSTTSTPTRWRASCSSN